MNAWQDVRCPGCDKILFKSFGASAHLIISIVCKCGRLVHVKEGFIAEVIGEAKSASR